MEDGVTRKEVLVQYERYLQDNMNFFMEAIKAFLDYEKAIKREITLGCFCKPHDCHVDILIKYADIAKHWRPPNKRRPYKRTPESPVIYDRLIEALRHQLDEREEVKQYGDKSVAVEIVFNDIIAQSSIILNQKQQDRLLGRIWKTVAEIDTDEYR
tara:strand:- start:19 stop:486 length:468 start_codon:yes stop_codon:yes gene_type:complete